MTDTDARRGALAARIARLTPEQRAELERRLPAPGTGDSGGAVISRNSGDGPVPLAHAQRYFWLLHRLAPQTAAATVAFAVRLEGDLRLDALRRAVHDVVRRHEALRMSFAEVDGEPYQTVLPFEQVADEVFATDLVDGDVRAWLAAETGRPFDLAAGRVFRVRVSRRGPREHVLLCTVHHIVADGWSLDLLVEEVLRRYAAVVAGTPDALPDPALRYRDYAVWQHALDDGPAFAYWRDQLAGAPACMALPDDRPGTAAAVVPAARRGGPYRRRSSPGCETYARQSGRQHSPVSSPRSRRCCTGTHPPPISWSACRWPGGRVRSCTTSSVASSTPSRCVATSAAGPPSGTWSGAPVPRSGRHSSTRTCRSTASRRGWAPTGRRRSTRCSPTTAGRPARPRPSASPCT